MHKIEIDDKLQIKQLLYSGCILGIKDSQFQAYGGFQLWWYDKKSNICHCAESHWADRRRQIKDYTLKKAIKTLWSNRRSVFMSTKHIPPDETTKVFKAFTSAHNHHRRN